MIPEIIKLYISNFVSQILSHDAIRFEYTDKEGSPNLNGFLNKIIPNIMHYRKYRREKIRKILSEDYQRKDTDQIYNCVNTVIDEVYFSDEELDILEDTVWFRPSIKKKAVFNEIADSETILTGQSVSVYIRGLLNEYSRLPQYLREKIAFNDELIDFKNASETGRIFHATVNRKSIRVFAFQYVYEWTYDQGNYLIGYDLTHKVIGAIPLYKIKNPFVVDTKYKPTEMLLQNLQSYYENQNFDDFIEYKEKS